MKRIEHFKSNLLNPFYVEYVNSLVRHYLNQKYNPNTINNTQNDKKPVSNAVLYNLETYEK